MYRREVAEFLGVNEHTIYYWEKGQTRPNTDNLNQLSRLYSVSVDYLVGRSEDPQHSTDELAVVLEGEPEITAMLTSWKNLSSVEKDIIRTAVNLARKSQQLREPETNSTPCCPHGERQMGRAPPTLRGPHRRGKHIKISMTKKNMKRNNNF